MDPCLITDCDASLNFSKVKSFTEPCCTGSQGDHCAPQPLGCYFVFNQQAISITVRYVMTFEI